MRFGSVLPALAVLLVAGATTAVTGSAAQATEVVDCSAGPVTLAEPSGVYQLVGACSEVDVAASGVTVTLPGATRIEVDSTDAEVASTGPVGTLAVVSSGVVVTAPSIHEARLDGTATDLIAGRVDQMSVDGTDVVVHVKKGTRATLTGSSGHVVFARLGQVRVTGSSNHVKVRKGVTRVSNTGSGNHIRVHARPRPTL